MLRMPTFNHDMHNTMASPAGLKLGIEYMFSDFTIDE